MRRIIWVVVFIVIVWMLYTIAVTLPMLAKMM